MRPIRMLVVMAAMLIGLAVSTHGAGAHSTLIRACPGPGDVLNDVDQLELEYRTPLIDDGAARVDLIRSGDENVRPAVGPVVFSDDLLTATIEVLEPLAPGRYILRYQVTSADGDLNDGGHEFTVDPDADAESDGCGIDGDGGGSGGIVLLGAGVVAVGALFWFLRPRNSPRTDKR